MTDTNRSLADILRTGTTAEIKAASDFSIATHGREVADTLWDQARIDVEAIEHVLEILAVARRNAEDYARDYRGSDAPKHQRLARVHDEVTAHLRRMSGAVGAGLLGQLAEAEAERDA